MKKKKKKKGKKKIDTTPTKAILIDEINKLPKELALVELVGGGVDSINNCKERSEKFHINIICDPKNDSIYIIDNRPGMAGRQLSMFTTIGNSFKLNESTKRFAGTWSPSFIISVFNIGKNVEIITREEGSVPRKIVFPNNYAMNKNDQNWEVDIWDYIGPDIPNSGGYTYIKIKNIKHPYNSNKDDFWVDVKETIERYISRKLIKLEREGKNIKIKVIAPSGIELKIEPKEDVFIKNVNKLG